MDREPRMSSQTLKLLRVLMEHHRDELAGTEIGRRTGLQSGTLYPILLRLETAGWLISRWESEDPTLLGRPRRRFYQITALGQQKAQTAFQDISPALGRLSWA